MGLDISAYKELTPMDAVFDADGDPIDPKTRKPLEGGDYFQMTENPVFPERADGITKGIYDYADVMRFRAGSYTGYTQWRNQLAKIAGYPPSTYDDENEDEKYAASAWHGKSGPFWELINFSDCEGTIGPKTSAKLAKDFADHQSKADSHESERFRLLYAEWRKAFEMAANEGAVSFH